MPARDPSDRALSAKIAISTRWANTPAEDRPKANAKARKTYRESFERQVDPDGILDPAERARRAQHAFNAHMARLALKSARARRARAAKKAAGRKAQH